MDINVSVHEIVVRKRRKVGRLTQERLLSSLIAGLAECRKQQAA
jgi:hypothetical protein